MADAKNQMKPDQLQKLTQGFKKSGQQVQANG